jgi:hypothetical protein
VSAQTHQVSNSFYDYSGYTVSAAVAPKFSLRGKWTLSPSLDLEYLGGRSTVNDIRNLGFEGERWRGRAGLLVNTSKFYFGYSFVVMDRLSQRFSNGISKAGRPTGFNSYLQLGYTFQRSPESNFSFTPQLTWAIGTGDFPAFDYRQKAGINYFQAFSLNFRYKQFIWGVNNTGVHVGWQSSRVKVMASNGIGSAGDGSSGYAGNVSLRYMVKDNPTSTRW